MRSRFFGPIAAVLSFFGTASAQAIIAQPSGLPLSNRLIDFGANLLPNFTPVSTQFPGITVTHASYFTTGVSNNLVGGFLTNDFSAGPPDTLSIQFASVITDVSFVYHQIGSGTTVMRAMLQGVTMDSISIAWNQSLSNNYFGFTNTVFDELQIDFLGDFNLDTLAYNDPSGARCDLHNGTGINPVDFTCTTLPVLGTTWQGLVATTPNTLLTFLAYAPAGLLPAPVPLFNGELLIQVAPPPVAFSSATGNYSLAIPSSTTWIGTVLTFQGLRLDLVGPTSAFVLLNAMDVVVGQ